MAPPRRCGWDCSMSVWKGTSRRPRVAFAERLVREGRALPAHRRPASRGSTEPGVFEEFTRTLAQEAARVRLRPWRRCRPCAWPTSCPSREGLRREHERCLALLHGPQSRAQRHAFAVEREVARVPGSRPGHPGPRDRARPRWSGPASWGAASPCVSPTPGSRCTSWGARAAGCRAGAGGDRRPSTPPPSRAVPSRGRGRTAAGAHRATAASEADLAAADLVVEAIARSSPRSSSCSRAWRAPVTRRRSSPATPRSWT